MKAVLPALARPLLEPHLSADLEVVWFTSPAEANAMIADADIAWVDMQPNSLVSAAVLHAGRQMKWLNTIYAGLDAFPLDFLHERGVVLTNGVGINAIAVAEYAMLGVLAAAKRFDEVVRIADRHEWSVHAPGRVELFETSALIVGMGAIGQLIAARLAAFGVDVIGVTRSGRDGTLRPDQWKNRLGDFDWVILAAPSTGETRHLLGTAEFGAMKPSSWLINIARGDMIDQDALIVALKAGEIAGAFLDPTDPEPLPADHPLWDAPNTMITMHLSGRSQTKMYQRGAALFLDNLAAFLADKPMTNRVDLAAGY